MTDNVRDAVMTKTDHQARIRAMSWPIAVVDYVRCPPMKEDQNPPTDPPAIRDGRVHSGVRCRPTMTVSSNRTRAAKTAVYPFARLNNPSIVINRQEIGGR